MQVSALLGGGDEERVKSGFKVSSLFELVKEMWNIKGVMAFEGKQEFYFKHLSAVNLWDIREEVLGRHLKIRVCFLMTLTVKKDSTGS